FGYDVPNERPYEVVRRAVSDARRRSAAVEGAGIVRPWLQDFTLGQPVYAGAEVRAQIQAVYDAGGDEWVLWNPGSNYTEAALEPVGGFDREPLVRVGGLLTPVSRRYIVMDSIASVAVSTDGVAAEQADTPSSAFPD
ncbi:MAG: putative glycoside hydrolase, partial [Gemmatimonadota bacterium]